MASANYKGFGASTSDWVLIAGLALAGFFLYKTFVKPVSDVEKSGTDLLTGTTDLVTSGEKSLAGIWEGLSAGINNLANNVASPKTSNNRMTTNNPVTGISSSNYVTSVKNSGSAYGNQLVTVTTSKGQSSTIIQSPNLFYPKLGIGFDSKNQGYSSFKPLDR